MKIKKIIFLSIVFILSVVGFVGCGDNGNTPSSSTEENYSFKTEYQAEYGEMYYFEKAVLNNQALEYEVKNGGNAVAVSNYGFMVSSMNDYAVNVKYRGKSSVLASFKITVAESVAPNVSLSYYRKFVLPNTTVELPGVSVSDNQDKNVNFTAKLTRGGSEISCDNGEFEAVSGEYVYTVKATDSNGNISEKKCVITVGGELQVATGVNWSNPDTDIEYCREISGGTMGTSEEIAYGGFNSSFKVSVNNAVSTTCITVKNALINDISEYDYFIFYVYNNMTSRRQYSVNWSPEHLGDLNVGEWTPIAYPINENLVSDSNNSIYRATQDWTKLNGLRLYIQDSPVASGDIYLSDIFLFKTPDRESFDNNVSEFENIGADDDWQSLYNLIDAQSVILKKANPDIDLSEEQGRVLAKYSSLVLNDDYDKNTIAYADKKLQISQLIGYGDIWSIPLKVEINEDIAYGSENGSFEITFNNARNRANTRGVNLSVYDKAPVGEIVFYVKNATKSELKIYNNETAKMGEWYVDVSTEWQEVRLAVDSEDALKEFNLICYTKDGEPVKPMDDGTAKMYYSNIRFVPYEKSGTYTYINEQYIEAFAEKWNTNAVVSYSEKPEDLYEGHGVMSVRLTQQDIGRYGLLLSSYKLKALLNHGSVKLTVKYNASKSSARGTYIGFFGTDLSNTVLSGWNSFSVIFNEVPANFILGVADTPTMEWSGYGIDGEFLIAEISYEIVDFGDFGVKASSQVWQDPASFENTNSFSYGDEQESMKSGFKVGYKYANFIITPFTEDEYDEIKFFILNKTGKPLQVYIYSGQIIEIAASDTWQEVRLNVSSGESEYVVNVRGKNEIVVNDSEIVYYYISQVKSV